MDLTSNELYKHINRLIKNIILFFDALISSMIFEFDLCYIIETKTTYSIDLNKIS